MAIMSRIWKRNSGEDGTIIRTNDDLLLYCSHARDVITTLTSQLASSAADSELAAFETQAKTELQAARRALERYERILGPHSKAADGNRELGDRLVQSDKERAKLELKLCEAEAVRSHRSEYKG